MIQTYAGMVGFKASLVGKLPSANTDLPLSDDNLAVLLLALGDSGYTYLELRDGFNTEIVKAMTVRGKLKIVRGLEATTASTFPNGSYVGWVMTPSAVRSIIRQLMGCPGESTNPNPDPDPPPPTSADYLTTAAMLADNNLFVGATVTTLNYGSVADKGGARYKISDSPTPYSLRLRNGLHAIFDDVFDIRKFGIVNSEFADQSENILRMARYSDIHEQYIIDFHNFRIRTPNLNAGITGVLRDANGMWFERTHDIRNLYIAHDKTVQLRNGKCCIIFCPLTDAKVQETFKLTNVKFDPWVENFQAYDDNYLSAHDGMRHGFVCYPKDRVNDRIFIDDGVDNASNYNFDYVDVEFVSAAYSYNISTASVRSRAVTATRVTGDAMVNFNMDAIRFVAKDCKTTIRLDLQERGRVMVMSNFHYEAEHNSRDKDHLNFRYDLVSLDNCHVEQIEFDGRLTKSGQLLWCTALNTSTFKKILVNNCSGNVDLQGWKALYEDIEFVNCLDHTFLRFNNILPPVKKVVQRNCILEARVASRTDFIPTVYNSFIESWLVMASTYKSPFYYGSENIPKPLIGDLVFDNIDLDYVIDGTVVFCTNFICDSFTVKNSNLLNARAGLIRFGSTFKNIVLDNVKFGELNAEPMIDMRYLTTSDSTTLTLNNVTAETPNTLLRFLLSGKVIYNGTNPDNFSAGIPRGVGDQTRGIGTIATEVR